MRILLIQPPHPDNNFASELDIAEPLALEIIASTVSEHELRILDMRIDNKLEETINSFKPDIVGTTTYTAGVYKTLELLKKIKSIDERIFTVIGGHHATFVPEDFCKEYVNAIVIGEGEETFPELVKAIENKEQLTNIQGLAISGKYVLTLTQERNLIKNLNDLKFPDRKLTEQYRKNYFRGNWKPYASLYSSRGCPFRCNFCAMWKISYGKFRIRDVDKIVEELQTIEEEYIGFTDDNTLHNLDFAEKLYEAIKDSGIKKKYKICGRSDTIVRRPDIIEKWQSIGLALVYIGFESFRDEDLKNYNKHNTIKNNEEAIRILKKNNVEVISYFMVNQDFTESDFKALSDYIKKMELCHPVFTILVPFPGTDLYEKVEGKLITKNYEHFDFWHSVLPTKLPLKEFYLNFINLYKNAYDGNASSAFSKEFYRKIDAGLSKMYNL